MLTGVSIVALKNRLGKGIVGIDEEAKVVFILKDTAKGVVESLSKRGYKIIELDSEFTVR
jgi:hypothetical protein